jgi:hypothetical protein
MGISKKKIGNGGCLAPPPEPWREHWWGMPEFIQEDLSPWRTVEVRARLGRDMGRFLDLVGQRENRKGRYTPSIWYPEAEIGRMSGRRYVSTDRSLANPRYPIYVISKGRWERRLTSNALERMSVPYHIVVEPQEYDSYASVIDPAKILTLPFSNLGRGSIPVRNWVWTHSRMAGHARHWCMDDNMDGFFRLNRNLKLRVATGAMFRVVEDFTDRYGNISLSGLNYFMFASRKTSMPPFYLNTRIYSCILIDNSLPFRWRGRYNEDTDLSLQVLKSGLCIVLFNAFLAMKQTTMTMSGGNTDELYKQDDKFDGQLEMTQSLEN